MTAADLTAPAPMRRSSRWAMTGVAAIVTAVAIAVPSAVFVRTTRLDPDAIPHEGAPSVELDRRAVELAADVADSTGFEQPVVLSYHDVRDLEPGEEPEDHYTVTPEQFAEHVAALDAAGFRTISSEQLAGWLDGEPLPPRSVYLTFDDGSSGLWRHADAVLAEHGFRAAAFVITGRVGRHRPYYLDWDELRAMAETGRWDLESHTRLGHDRIPVDAQGGRRLPFLINRAWLEDEGRIERVDEVVARVESDLAGSRDDLERNGLGRARFFAYPFSAETRPTNDESIPPLVAEVIDGHFEASLSNDEPDRLVSERDRRRRTLSRIEVFRFTTAAGLLERLANARPVEPRGVRPLLHPEAWSDSSGRSLVASRRHESSGAMPDSPDRRFADFGPDGTLTATPAPGRYLGALFAPGRTEDWRDYAVAVTVEGLGQPEAGPSASLHALVGSSMPVQLSVSAGFARVRTPEGTVDARIPAGDSHRLELRVATGKLVAVVDGTAVATIATPADESGGIALGASGVPAGSGGVRFRHLAVGAVDDALGVPAIEAPPVPPEPPPGFSPEPPAGEWPVDPSVDDEPDVPTPPVGRSAGSTGTGTTRPARPPSTTASTAPPPTGEAPSTSTTRPPSTTTSSTTTTTAPSTTTTTEPEPPDDGDGPDDDDRDSDGDGEDDRRDDDGDGGHGRR